MPPTPTIDRDWYHSSGAESNDAPCHLATLQRKRDDIIKRVATKHRTYCVLTPLVPIVVLIVFLNVRMYLEWLANLGLNTCKRNLPGIGSRPVLP